MSRNTVIASLKAAVLAGLVTAVSMSSTQAQPPRYTPSRPTVSPYLNLLRNDNGTIPNYYSLVRPQLNQLDFDNQVRISAKSQALAVRRLETLSQQQGASSSPTGTGSVFNNLSHYYPQSRR